MAANVDEGHRGLDQVADDQGWEDGEKAATTVGDFLDPLGLLKTGANVQYTPEGFAWNPNAGQLGTTYQQLYGQMGLDAQGRQAAQMAGPNGTAQGYTAAQQQALIQALQQRAAGQGMSAAEIMMRGQGQRISSDAYSNAAGARGMSSALASRMAGQQSNQAQLMNAQQMGALRANEQAQAESTLGGVLQGVRGQDQGWAALQQQAASTNLGAEMQQRQLNDQYTSYFMSLGMSADQAQMAAAIEIQKQQAEEHIRQQELEVAVAQGNAGQLQQEKGANAGFVGSLLSSFGSSS